MNVSTARPRGRRAAWQVAACVAVSFLAEACVCRAAPIPIKVVIVTTFEADYSSPNATGVSPGEAVRWIRGYHLDRILPLPAGFRPVRLNGDGVMETMTGMTTGKAAASTMALGLDPRFDFTHAYWMLAGIAGIDPARGAQGSAAWAEWVVDGDIDNFVDPREIPPTWPDGHIPWDAVTPFDPLGDNIGQMYHLNPGLVHWAFELTRDTPIRQTEAARRFGALFTNYPAAQQPPRVMIGDNLASATYWQGTLGARWARRWVKLYTGGKGVFTTSSCEDSGFMQSITFLGHAGRIDPSRVLILRTASDYCIPHPGMTSAESLNYNSPNGAYMADREAFQSAFDVGKVVVDEVVNHWDRYREHAP